MSTLRLADIAAADRTLEVVVDGTVWQLPVRGQLTIAQMARLLQLEQAVNDARSDGAALIRVCEDVLAGIMVIVRERTPDAPDLDLSLPEAMAVLGWLAGDTSVTAAVADAITPDEDTCVVEEGASGPLDGRSASSSSGLSSSSAGGTDGGPSGGPDAPGERSAPIFATSSGS